MSGSPSCASCPVRANSVCSVLVRGNGRRNGTSGLPEPPYESAKPHHTLYARSDGDDNVYMLCEGWAFRFLALPDGRRQILRFLLPGDLFSAHMVLNESLDFSVQSLTAVRFARFRRPDLAQLVAARPNVLQVVAAACGIESRETDELVVSLGRRNAEGRIALLLLTIVRRLRERMPAPDERYVFPLRQHHIADMTGLTPVHVGRVVNALRQSNILELAGGFLRIREPARLERLARI